MKALSLLTGLLVTGLSPLGAAVIPYTNDFSGTGTNTAFPNEVLDAQWTVSAGSYVYNTSATNFAVSTASLQLTDPMPISFTMETTFTLTSAGNFNSNGSTIGFGLLGLTSDFSGGSAGSYYLADLSVASTGSGVGTLRILTPGYTNNIKTGLTTVSAVVDANPDSANLSVIVGESYVLRLEGIYVGGTLNMTLGLYEADGITQIGSSATASDTSPLSGTYFGYRNRVGLAGGTFTTNFDSFSVVPEPSVAGLVFAGAAFLGVCRRVRESRA